MISIKNKSFLKLQRILLFLFFISILSSFVLSQGSKFTEESMRVTPVLGIGSGTLAVIIAIALGVVICIFGLAFPFPGLFVFIGIVIPCIVFIFVIFCPRVEEQTIIEWQNQKVNSYIIARWFHFLIMLLMFLGLLAPLIIYLSIVVIPQRVDSRAQLQYDEQYLNFMENEKMKQNRLMERDEPELLPLNPRLRRNQASINESRVSNLVNNDSQVSDGRNINNESNIINNNQLPPSMLPRSTLQNDIQDNRKKFAKFKRVKKDKK